MFIKAAKEPSAKEPYLNIILLFDKCQDDKILIKKEYFSCIPFPALFLCPVSSLFTLFPAGQPLLQMA